MLQRIAAELEAESSTTENGGGGSCCRVVFEPFASVAKPRVWLEEMLRGNAKAREGLCGTATVLFSPFVAPARAIGQTKAKSDGVAGAKQVDDAHSATIDDCSKAKQSDLSSQGETWLPAVLVEMHYPNALALEFPLKEAPRSAAGAIRMDLGGAGSGGGGVERAAGFVRDEMRRLRTMAQVDARARTAQATSTKTA